MNFAGFFLAVMLTVDPQPDTLTFQQVPYRYDTGFFMFDSTRVAFIDTGKGEPILFLHGVGSDLSQWELNYPTLADSYRVLGIDLPGFGKSDKHRVDYTMAYYSAVIDSFLNDRHIQKISLVGHSFGGHLAAYFALHHAERVKNLVLVDAAGIQEYTPEQKVFILSQYDLAKLSRPNADELRFGLKLSFVTWKEEYEKTISQRMALSRSPEYGDYAFATHGCMTTMLKENVKKDLPNLNVPTLIIWGARDVLVPVDFAEEAHRLIVDSQLVIMPECGHFPMIEKSEEFNRTIDQFLGGEDE